MKFKQMTYNDRLKMETLLNAGHNKAYVARFLGYSRATITREYQRGAYMHRNSDYSDTERYSAQIAQTKRDFAQTAKGKEIKLGSDYALVEYLENKIHNEKYSPAAALAEIENKGLKFDVQISISTLYRYIKSGLFLNISVKDLPVVGKRDKTRKLYRCVQKRASAGKSIEKRSDAIESRNTFGHWEMDTVRGKQGITKSCLLVLTERLTRAELIFKLDNGKAKSVCEALDSLEHKLRHKFSEVFKTITVDNGVEFSDCDGMQKSCLQDGQKRTEVYYCHAYSSYERGSNENQNRMIRRHIYKGSDIDLYDDQYIHEVQTWLNNYPRRMFGYKTAFDMLSKHVGDDVMCVFA